MKGRFSEQPTDMLNRVMYSLLTKREERPFSFPSAQRSILLFPEEGDTKPDGDGHKKT